MDSYSVLMPVYYKDQPQWLLKSIQSMLDQTIAPNDFVIVCDGPLTQDLIKIIQDFKKKNEDLFQVIQLEKNCGLGQALNIGMQSCKNDIIARMDADDISFPNRCELQIEKLTENKLDIVSGTVAEFETSPNEISTYRLLPETHSEIIKFAKRRCPFNHPSVMYKKSAVLQAGGYQSFYLCEDYYLWVRMLQSGAIGYNIQSSILYMRAGTQMYLRRAGLKYYKSLIIFRWYLKKTEFCTWIDFFYTALAQAFVCLLPNKLRIKIYNVFLRGKIDNKQSRED